MRNTADDRNLWQRTLIYFGALILNILLGWILAKINTHYLAVAEYGRYSFFLIFLYMSRSFFGFGLYESVSRQLAMTADELKRRQLTGLALSWSLIFYILFAGFFLLAALFADQVFAVRIGDLLFKYAWVAGLVLLHTFMLLALRGYSRMALMAEATIYPRIVHLALLIAIIWAGSFTLDSTILAMFAGFALTIFLTAFRLRPVFSGFAQLSGQLFREVRAYGVHLYIGAIWHELLFHADKLVISFYLDERSIAYYALAYMITFPLSHFSTALATTMFRKFSESESIDRRVLLVNFMFVCCSVALMILLKDEIILRLFSPDYLASVGLIVPLAIAFGLSGFSKPFTLFLMARGRGKVIRNIAVAVPLVQIGVTLLAVPEYGIAGAAWCTAVVYLLDLVLNIFAFRHYRTGQPAR